MKSRIIVIIIRYYLIRTLVPSYSAPLLRHCAVQILLT
jgi:hypothetical protein